MVRYTIRMPDGTSDKLRWLAYKQRRSQHSIVLELLKEGLKGVRPPKEGRHER